MPEAVSVFLAPPSWDALEQRLADRGTGNARRDGAAVGDRAGRTGSQDEFDVVVVNSQLESACAELVSLLAGNAPEQA